MTTTTNTTNTANTVAATPAFDFWGSILTGLKASMPFVGTAAVAGAIGYVIGQRQSQAAQSQQSSISNV